YRRLLPSLRRLQPSSMLEGGKILKTGLRARSFFFRIPHARNLLVHVRWLQRPLVASTGNLVRWAPQPLEHAQALPLAASPQVDAPPVVAASPSALGTSAGHAPHLLQDPWHHSLRRLPPPSTKRLMPVMKLASSEARKSAA